MSVAVIDACIDVSRCHPPRLLDVVRWQPHARGRLEEAALQLCAEKGFGATSVAEIAERAELTERTFFRHFADKREVLFSGQQELNETLMKAVEQAPDSVSPLHAVGAGLDAVVALFVDRWQPARRRQAVIDATPALQERELAKLASLVTALSDTLSRRGVPATTARLTAELGVAVFKVAFERWIGSGDDDAGRGRADLGRLIHVMLGELASIITHG